jgi:hypothetical protein
LRARINAFRPPLSKDFRARAARDNPEQLLALALYDLLTIFIPRLRFSGPKNKGVCRGIIGRLSRK